MKKTILSSLAITMMMGTAVNAEEATYDNVTGLYSATFNRAPDEKGLKYWVDTKKPLEDIAKSFFEQPEAQALYPDGGADSANFVQATYKNLFNREPDNEGMDYWKGKLEKGEISKSEFILAVVNGAKGDDAEIMANKKQVGLDFVKKGGNDPEKAKEAMKDITKDKKSIEDAWKKFDYTPEQAELDHVRGKETLDSKNFADSILGKDFHKKDEADAKKEQSQKQEQANKNEADAKQEQSQKQEQANKNEADAKKEQSQKQEQANKNEADAKKEKSQKQEQANKN
jgi:hypothetical protein